MEMVGFPHGGPGKGLLALVGEGRSWLSQG